jgi:hypothetical protein
MKNLFQLIVVGLLLLVVGIAAGGGIYTVRGDNFRVIAVNRYTGKSFVVVSDTNERDERHTPVRLEVK